MRATARVKLGAVNLERFFHGGGYGSDSPVRDLLPAVALRRMRRGEEGPFEARRAVMVGDTPHDLSAARTHGMRCALVATGQYTRDELAAAGPDVLLDDLQDGERALRAILEEERG
jgi:phosphoglycolate phosphatase-like HAD superfamily hydrolase